MITVINCGSKKTINIGKFLEDKNIDYKIVKMDEIESIKEYGSGLIISGSPILLTENDCSDRFEFLKILDIPVLGICFGHQVIGIIYGSKIDYGKRIDGEETIEIVKDDALFSELEKKLIFIENHKEFITLPEDFILLARSESCAVEAMKHKDKNIYGIQFHPEVSAENGEKLLMNFCKLCKN